jgi:hypothetical protein
MVVGELTGDTVTGRVNALADATHASSSWLDGPQGFRG